MIAHIDNISKSAPVSPKLGIEIDVERKNALRRLDVDGLTALLGRLRSERQWPHEE